MTDYSKCTLKDLRDERRLAEDRVKRDQKLIAQLDSHIAVAEEKQNISVGVSSPAP